MYKRNMFRSLKVSIVLIMALLVPMTSVFASGGGQSGHIRGHFGKPDPRSNFLATDIRYTPARV